MPYVVVCPNCPARLKSQQPVPAGKNITCPHCKTSFTLAEPAKMVSDGSVSLPAPTKPNAKPDPEPKPVEPEVVDGANFEFDDKPKSKSRRDDDEDRPRSKKRRDDDEDDRPRSKKRRDDDDDRDRDDDRRSGKGPADDFAFDDKPKGKNRRDDDADFDEKPKSKSRRDDDDDDRPRSKKRRDDEDNDRDRDDRDQDEFDDDQPRTKKKGKKNNNKLLLLGIIGGAGAFIMLGVLLLILNLAGVFTLFDGGTSSDMMAWLPSETVEVEGFDLNEVVKNSVMLKNAKNDLREVENAGLKVEEMSSSVMGRKSGSSQDVFIVKLKANVDKDRVTKAVGGQEMNSNGKRYLKTKSNGAVFFASDRLVIITKTESTMTSLLTKEDGKVVIPDDMKKAINSANGHMWKAAVGSAADVFSRPGGPFASMPKPTMSVMNGKIVGSNMESSIQMTHSDSANAKNAGDILEKFVAAAKANAALNTKIGGEQLKGNPLAMFENSRVSISGSTVTLELTIPIQEGGIFK